jgi:hypothetical protein
MSQKLDAHYYGVNERGHRIAVGAFRIDAPAPDQLDEEIYGTKLHLVCVHSAWDEDADHTDCVPEMKDDDD